MFLPYPMRVAKLPLEILMSTNKGQSETDVVIDEKSHLRTLRSTTLTFELDLDNVKIYRCAKHLKVKGQ